MLVNKLAAASLRFRSVMSLFNKTLGVGSHAGAIKYK